MRFAVICFDLGGVVIELEFERFFKDVITISPLNKPDSLLLLEFWRQSDIYHQGKITDDEFYHQTCELLQICSLTQEVFYDSFNSVIANFNKEMIDLIKTLKQSKKYKIFALSNINSSHWDYLSKRDSGFYQLFDKCILSFRVHMTKPDPRIFQLIIKEASCKPENILYIDDGLNNIRSARELGIHAIHYTGVNNLKEEFKKLHVLN